jgi:hypothetical protein
MKLPAVKLDDPVHLRARGKITRPRTPDVAAAKP